MPLNTRSKILLLIFVALGIYYPALFAGVNSVDDFSMIASLEDQTHTDWMGMLLPGGGSYYRPLLLLTYALDKHLWDMSESFMHLENILLHAANTVLVYFLARRVLDRDEAEEWQLPLLSALLFALHPINTESVAWISGRTDPLASLFVLSSMLFLFKGLQENRYRYFPVATVLLLVGCLCKEIAVFFLPAACFLVLSYQSGDQPVGSWFSRDKLKRLMVLVAPFFVGGLAYLCVRFSASNGGMPSILHALLVKNGSLLNIARIAFKAFGFYVKKLFLPLPLNFAILQISNHYVWVGIASFALLLNAARRRTVASSFAVAIGLLLVPAILVTLSRVAWTPLAERYLYLPSAFFSIAFVSYLQATGERAGHPQVARLLVVLLLLPAAYFTAQRNITWQSNLALYADTARKSPHSAIIKNELAIALTQEGKTADADQLLEAAKHQDPRKRYALPYVNQANLKVRAGDLDGARALILQVLTDDATSDPAALRTLAMIDEKRLFTPQSPQDRKEIYREIGVTHGKLYQKTGNPLDLYRGGQMALFLGETEKARVLFEKAYLAAPEGTYFKPAAKKLAEKLKR